jgi:hypothetical protein
MQEKQNLTSFEDNSQKKIGIEGTFLKIVRVYIINI